MPKATQSREGVFISYARSDGEEFANILRQRLEAEGIPLWQDRVGMEGGRDWWLQITEALDRVEFMALVVTPNALKSDTVRKEWRYARQEGVCVYPIKGVPDLDFDSLPRWMRSAHFYDLEREWQKFINDLNTRCQTRRAPFMVEDLPEGFVPRPGEFDQLLQLLIDKQREEPVAMTAALKGAGGYGKTTLAKALCHDQLIQDAFDDGILWVTLGEHPGDLTGRVEDLIVTLSDERPGFTTQDAAISRLKELLADRDILIVIDDVWDRAHLNPFIQGGPRCARLITTRNLDTLPASATKVQVDAMRQNEATELLAAGLNHDGSLTRELTALGARVGEWPLLLGLVNSALRNRIENDKQSPRDAIDWVNKALTKRGLAYFDARNSDQRSVAVGRTIGVSLDLLSEQQRERYFELAIFPEDVEIPLSTLEKLWAKTGRFDEFDTEDLCSRLNSFSLLWSYDADRRRIRLHDVVHKFLIEQQTDKLPSIHAQLLDAHLPGGPWSEMPAEEPYLWDHLAHHLVEARQGDELLATVKSWRYLVAKTFVRKSLAVEADLLAAEQIGSDDDVLRLLRRNFVNFGHLLNKCENRNDIEATLFSRLQHLDNLKFFTTDLERNLKPPCLVPTTSLPDLPHPALVRTLSGRMGRVFACAMSADGTTIVSASEDETLKVWDARSGAERFTLSGHTLRVTGCAVSVNGATIVSSSHDKTLKVWDGRSGAERFTLTGHWAVMRGCCVSPDGLIIVSAYDDGTLKVWDGQNGAERFVLAGHEGAVTACAVSAEQTIVSASNDGTLKLWDARSGLERFTLRGHLSSVTGCAVSADGATIVSVSFDGTLKVWDGRSGTERSSLSGHQAVTCAVSADGGVIVSGSNDGRVKVWRGPIETALVTLSGHNRQVYCCAVNADGTTIVSGSADKTLKIWDGRHALVDDPRRVRFGGLDGLANSCALSADGTTVISASDDQTLNVWDRRSGALRLTLKGTVGAVKGCAITADGMMIVSTDDEILRVWDGQSGAERMTLVGHTDRVRDCAVSADGSTIVSVSHDDTLRVWDGHSGAKRFTLRADRMYLLTSCAVSHDGATIVSTSYTGMVKVWDARNGTVRFTLNEGLDVCTDCAVSADGTTIVSAFYERKLIVWDGWSGTKRFTLGDAVDGCAVSADGRTIVSASLRQALKVWDAFTGECLTTLFVDDKLDDCACSADGEKIVAVGPRGLYFLRLQR